MTSRPGETAKSSPFLFFTCLLLLLLLLLLSMAPRTIHDGLSFLGGMLGGMSSCVYPFFFMASLIIRLVFFLFFVSLMPSVAEVSVFFF